MADGRGRGHGGGRLRAMAVLAPALLAGAFARADRVRPGSLDAIPPLLAMLAAGVGLCLAAGPWLDRVRAVQPMAVEPPRIDQ